MLAALKAGNLLVTAAFMLVGTGAIAVMTYPLWPTPRPRPVMAAAIDQRWLPPEPPPLPKADRLRLAAADPLGPPVRLQPPPTSPSGPVEQALERKAEDEEEQRAARRYHRKAARRGLEEPRDVCARHGLRKVYVHHNRGWRCR